MTRILAKLDKKTRAVIENEPEEIKCGDVALVEFVPQTPLVVEVASEYPRFGRFLLYENRHLLATGIIYQVTKVTADGKKVYVPAEIAPSSTPASSASSSSCSSSSASCVCVGTLPIWLTCTGVNTENKDEDEDNTDEEKDD
jgi:hypothetical protein